MNAASPAIIAAAAMSLSTEIEALSNAFKKNGRPSGKHLGALSDCRKAAESGRFGQAVCAADVLHALVLANPSLERALGGGGYGIASADRLLRAALRLCEAAGEEPQRAYKGGKLTKLALAILG